MINKVTWRVNLILKEIESSSGSISLKGLAKKFNLNPSYLSFYIRKNTGKTFGEIRREIRINKGKDLLEKNPMLLVKQISSEIGYKDPGHFCKLLKERCSGKSPTVYKNHFFSQ